MKRSGFVLMVVLLAQLDHAMAQLDVAAARALVERIVPGSVQHFAIEPLAGGDKEAFEIESVRNNIVLRGSNGVAVASALYHYLKTYCNSQVTWNGTHLDVPAVLPAVTPKIHKTTPYTYRYYLNYCTFNYSMSWWDWNRWEKEIDWMALHGINMPLAITGEEYTWYEVYREMGFTDQDLKGFFSGPSYFSWFWMGNLDAWGGPLPVSWMKRHYELQKKIVQRQRALGMKPVLPAFTGHVPPAFKTKFPRAKLKATNWTNGFADTYILDAEDPMFAAIGKRFLQKQTSLYGTDHLYSADTFNENEPPSDEPAFLGKLSARIYDGMRQADTAAVWVMQGWLFYSDRKFWKEPQVEALLKAVPDNKMILLDLATEIEPVWKRTQAFYGKPWIWNMLNNFGGNVNLFGRIEGVAKGPAEALHDTKSGRLMGIGLTMEGIEQNPVLYELMMDHAWNDQPIELNGWLDRYISNRYGSVNARTTQAWQTLVKTVYNGKDIRDGAESIITGRPTLDSAAPWTRTKLNYPAAELLPAWDDFVAAIDLNGAYDGFQFDLVDVTRQVLANHALPIQRKWVAAYRNKNLAEFSTCSRQYIELIEDLDKLLATRKDFLLGPWIRDARSWGTTAAEKALYEQNARDLITLWGDANSPLHEYANRQWSGLLNDFYKVRWQRFFRHLDAALLAGKEADLKGFEEEIKQWEWNWVNARKDYPVVPAGNPLEEVRRIYSKYRQQME